VKTIVLIGMVVFVAVLALALGSRLPTDAITVVIGVACGVLASIPTSVLIIAVALRREAPAATAPLQQQYPPVVVVNAPPGAPSGYNQAQQWPGAGPSWPAQMPPPGPRQFRIIGQENVMVDCDHSWD